ncbi:MAG: glycosyltransferase family 2 protein [Candidatus Komeilibacteria bacterium]|nr:glycosyltransferase family 2 protein [Candidatus Komeilibacteria bacterium]
MNNIMPAKGGSASGRKKVCIIIVNYNGQKYLPDLLGSIFSNQPNSVLQEVVLVDNASVDNSLNWLKQNYPQVTVLAQTENYGFAKGNNIGINWAMANGCDYVFLLNSDTLMEAGCLDKLVSAIEQDDKIAVIQPKILLWPLTDLINSLGNVIHYLGFGYTYGHKTPTMNHQLGRSIYQVNYCSGAACLIKLEALARTGLFNEEFFMYHEDLDLGWRFSLMGYKNMIEPRAVVYHKYEFSRSIQKYYYMERNRWLVMLQNYKLLTLLLILPALLMMEAGLVLLSILGGWHQEKFRVYLYFLRVSSWKKLWLTRRQIQKQRVVSDRAAVKKFSGVIEHQDSPARGVDKIANIFFNAYWQIIRLLIIW